MKTWLVLLLGLFLNGSAFAQEGAGPRYDLFYKIFQVSAAVQGKDARGAVVITPKDQNLDLSKVSIAIAAEAGPIALTIDPDGEMHGFPFSDELLKENPPIITNQPKGSLNLLLELALSFPDTTTLSGRQLQALVDAALAQTRKQTTTMPSAPTGVAFVFADHSAQTLTIESKAAPRKIESDALGRIKFTLDEPMLAENAVLTLSKKPAKVLVEF